MSMIALFQVAAEKVSDIPQGTKNILDVAAGATVGLSWISTAQSVITLISTLVGLVWICIRVIETETYKNWRNKKKKDDVA